MLINTESVQTADQAVDEKENTIAFQSEILAHQCFLFQQKKSLLGSQSAVH